MIGHPGPFLRELAEAPIAWVYRRMFRRYTSAAIITDRTPLEPWLPRTFGDVLNELDTRNEY